MLLLTRGEVEELLDPDELIDAVGQAMADLSAGRASAPARVAATIAERGAITAAMPAWVAGLDALTTKLVNVFPGNAGGPYETHQAVIVAFDPANGRPSALMDGAAITALRTAAGSALSARLLARADAGVLAVLGTGVQARAHLLMMPRVRRLSEVRVWGRDPTKAAQLVAAVASELPARAVATIEEACDGAGIVSASTHATEPVVRRALLAPGTHVTSVGYNVSGREVDAETVRDALLVVESRETIVLPPPAGANDIAWPIRAGLIDASHIHAEIGELVAGVKEGRTADEQLTLYKSVGNAVQDAAAASLVLAAARARGIGREIDLD